jgi:hypothetical protein
VSRDRRYFLTMSPSIEALIMDHLGDCAWILAIMPECIRARTNRDVTFANFFAHCVFNGCWKEELFPGLLNVTV